MLSTRLRNRLTVVLVSSRNPLNIGAAARAMANFGFTSLAVVAPYEEHWREAKSAVGAPDLLHNASESQSLAEAVSDCTLVVGTGAATRRRPEHRVVPLPELAAPVLSELERGGRVALVFGSEKRGLRREDLSHCHLLAEIPTHPRQPSMNLGQAVAVCLYELAVHGASAEGLSLRQRPQPPDAAPSAPSGDLDRLAGVLDQVMLAAHYSPPSMHDANRHDLRLLLRRLALTQPDAQRVLGFFRRVLRRLER